MNFRLLRYFDPIFSGLLTHGSFSRNIFVSFSGNAISLILGFCLTPFIARVYGPEVYGVFALFVAIISSLSPLATLQFPSGYVQAEDPKELNSLIIITLAVVGFGTLVLLLLISFFRAELLEIVDSSELLPFAYFIPLQFFLMGIDNILLGWNIHNKEFGVGAKAKIFSVIGSKVLTLCWGIFIQASVLGMIVGNILVYPFESILKVSSKIRTSTKSIFDKINLKFVLSVFRKYSYFPLFVTPGVIISNLGSQLPIYLFAIYFDNAYVGMFALATSLVMMPLSILINSSTSVFLQRAAEINRESPESLKAFVKNLYGKLFIIGLVPLVIFSFISEWAFRLLLGDAWGNAGYFASFIAISAILSVVALPLSVLFRILNKERLNLQINILFTVIKAGGLFWGILNENIVLALIGYCIATIISYGVSLFSVFRIIDLNVNRLYRDLLLVGGIFAGFVLLNGVKL